MIVLLLENQLNGYEQMCEMTHLSPPFSALRSILNSLNQGRTIYLMYSRHGFFSTTFGGQKAFFILTFTSAFGVHAWHRKKACHYTKTSKATKPPARKINYEHDTLPKKTVALCYRGQIYIARQPRGKI